ncbi:MAG: hypothetical protein Q7V05_01890 [Methanoregula sp.]|nr:hypothetical protein [Methanoregula sp.]
MRACSGLNCEKIQSSEKNHLQKKSYKKMLRLRHHFFLGAAFFADFLGSGFFAAAFFAAAMWFFTSYRKGLYFLLIYQLINILVATAISRIELG